MKKVFTLVEGGFKKFWRLAKGGSKKFDDKNFQLPSPPPTKVLMNTPLDIRSVSTTSVDGCCSSSHLQRDHDTGYDSQFYFDDYFDYELGTNEPIVKGRLRSCTEFWRKIDANPEVLDIIQFGYKLPFIESPPSLFSKNNKSALCFRSNFRFNYQEFSFEHHEPPFVVNPERRGLFLICA